MSKDKVKKEAMKFKGKTWEDAISDGETQIEAARKRIAELRSAVSVFRKNLENGVPVPGHSERTD